MIATDEVVNVPPTAARPCGLIRRLLVMLYDAIVVVALLMFAAVVALLLRTGNLTAGRDPLYTLYLVGVWFLYLAWCWRHGGMTLGMRAWRVRIESVDGGAPGWGQCAGRFLCSLLSAAAAGLGFLVAAADAERRTWHDRASRTRLRHVPPADPSSLSDLGDRSEGKRDRGEIFDQLRRIAVAI